MSDLSARIRAIVRERRRQDDPVRPRAAGDSRAVDPDRAAACLGGRVVETAAGHCVVIDRLYRSGQRYGNACVSDYAVRHGHATRLLSGGGAAPSGPGRADPDRVVFVDLETTGLSGGAGTCAFLVGCGHFVDAGFQTRQFFLPGLSQEPALLDQVFSYVRQAASVVTFNGKSFDVPMLENRWAFHRMRATLDDMHHLDMLHPARRLWRRPPTREARSAAVGTMPRHDGSRESCSLQTLERLLLGVVREGDPGGWEIPSLYFHYVRSGDAERLEPVLEHNRLDLISLAGLTARAIRLVDQGPTEAASALECLGLGRLYERLGRHESAMRCYGDAVGLSAELGLAAGPPMRFGSAAEPEVRCDALRRLARGLRRQRRYADAALVWQRLVEAGPTRVARLEALEALAVHHEHRTRELDVAKRLATQAMAAPHEPGRGRRLEHRLARLDRKLDGVASAAPTSLPLRGTSSGGR